MVLERPLIFLPYDLEEYEKSVGFTMDYDENTPGPKPSTFEDFLAELKNIKNNPQPYINKIAELNVRLNSPYKNSSLKLEEFIRSRI